MHTMAVTCHHLHARTMRVHSVSLLRISVPAILIMIAGQVFNWQRGIAARGGGNNIKPTKQRELNGGQRRTGEAMGAASISRNGDKDAPLLGAAVAAVEPKGTKGSDIEEWVDPVDPAPLAALDQPAEDARRTCIKQKLEQAMGWAERGEHFYFRGCNFKPVIDLEAWTAETGCGIAPLEGPLYVATHAIIARTTQQSVLHTHTHTHPS